MDRRGGGGVLLCVYFSLFLSERGFRAAHFHGEVVISSGEADFILFFFPYLCPLVLPLSARLQLSSGVLLKLFSCGFSQRGRRYKDPGKSHKPAL